MSNMEGLKKAITEIILNPRYADFLAVIKAARSGAVYGAKVRFPHALVMIFLFRPGTVQEKLTLIFKATRTHAANLARFATVYKLTMVALKYLSTDRKEGPYDTFLSGLLGGYLVFGRRSPRTGRISSVNQQIVIYVFARVVLALARLSVKPSTGIVTNLELSNKISENAWPVFAACSWGMVMWVFRWYPESVQTSLRSSMTYIYKDSDHWDSLRTLLWHNK